jgi:metal-responsive CopG/Arc/MetJ family transcriptional regulator
MKEWTVEKEWTIGRRGIHNQHLVIRLPFAVKEELKKISEQTRLSVSELIRIAINNFLQEFHHEQKLHEK